MKEIIARIRGYLFLFKCRYFKKNISIGDGLKLYCKLEVKGKGRVSIGKNCIVSGVIGDRRHYVTIYTHSPEAVVVIGENAMLFAARISSKFRIMVGDDFLIEESGIMDTDFHSINSDRGEPKESKEKCGVQIGNRVSIGARSFVCKGVTIGDNVVVWPGSIVSKSIPSRATVCGNPSRVMINKSSGL
jgi:acetyltransferase-like isoleucine patch superfamily enzyme